MGLHPNLMLTVRDETPPYVDYSPLAGRVAYATVCVIALALVSGCFTLRIQHLSFRSLIRLPLIRIYLLIVYLWGVFFIISVAILRFGFGVTDDELCLTSIMLCLVFYVVDKVVMYLFLVERIHVVRRRRYSRGKDIWYHVNLSIVILGFGCIGVLAFCYPVADVSAKDNQCRIGLPFKVTLPLLVYDVAINIYLTAHFVYFARPHVRSLSGQSLFRRRNARLDDEIAAHSQGQNNMVTLRKLARRTLKGMCVMLAATIVNLSILFHMRGREQAWMCFMFCTIDVAVGILTLHWVTNDPSEADLGRTSQMVRHPGHRHERSQPPSHQRGNPVIPNEMPLKPVTTTSRAWADEEDHHSTAELQVPGKIVVTTRYGCDEHHDRASPPKRMSSTHTESLDGEEMFENKAL